MTAIDQADAPRATMGGDVQSLRERITLASFIGVPFVAMRYSALRGSSSRYGGSFSIISIAMIPSDQMSTFAPYSFCFTTSGAIQ